MHIEYLHTFVQIGHVDIDLSVKTTGAQQRLIQNICAVGCGQNDDAAIRSESVHFGQQLVKCILTLVVASKVDALATSTTNSVDLVDKDD